MNSLVVANVKQRPLRTALSLAGVALGVILVVMVAGLVRGVSRDSIERQMRVDSELRVYADNINIASGANPLQMPRRYADAIKNGVRPAPENPDIVPRPPVAGVKEVTAVGLWLQTSVGGIGFETVEGIDWESLTKTTGIEIIEGRPIDDSRKGEPRFEVIVDRYYTQVNKGADGKTVRVGSTITALNREFTVVGVYEPAVMSRIKMPLYTMQELTGGAEVADNCSFLMVKCERPEMADEVRETIKKYYPGLKVIRTDEIPALYSQGLVSLDIFLNVVIAVSIIISTMIILLAMYTTIIERTREIGILKSLGASKPLIVWAIEKEATLISALGVAVGFLVSIGGKYFVEASTRLKIDLEPRWLFVGAAMGLVCGLAGALYPAIRAANLDPVEAISYE
ncbi:MAG: ABC transporter permease [Acidobacteriota bacterium]